MASPEFWVSLFTILGSLIGIWWWFVGRKQDRAKAQQAEVKKSEELEAEKQKEALKERPEIDESIQKQNEAREDFEF